MSNLQPKQELTLIQKNKDELIARLEDEPMHLMPVDKQAEITAWLDMANKRIGELELELRSSNNSGHVDISSLVSSLDVDQEVYIGKRTTGATSEKKPLINNNVLIGFLVALIVALVYSTVIITLFGGK